MDVVGKGGMHLREAWAEAPEAYLGITAAKFPNMFILYGPNTNLGHNSITFMLERQVEYAVKAITEMQKRGIAAMEVKQSAQDALQPRTPSRPREDHVGRPALPLVVQKRQRPHHAKLVVPHARLRESGRDT